MFTVKHLVLAFLCGVLVTASGFEGYIAYRDLEIKVDYLVKVIAAMSVPSER